MNFVNFLFGSNIQNNNYSSAINAVKNAYLDDVVIVGAGLPYDGTFPLGFPANLGSDHVVFTVGAANETNDPFQFSGTPESDGTSYNPDDINLIAPGVDLQTTLPGGNQYGNVSGTNASAALTTGIISLLQDAEGDLTPDDVAHILEKTAAPVGGPGYDQDSGFGIIDAGAAMNYVDNYDIKHGIATNGQMEQIFDDRQITLVSSAWAELASGVYFVDEYEVTYTIPLIPSPDNDLWFNAKGTYGWTPANPNDQNRYAKVELFNDHAKVTTYIYDVLSGVGGQDIGWFPASPENVQLSYSYVGEIAPPPLTVSIDGPRGILTAGNYTWEAEPENGNGSYSYEWEYKPSLGASWTTVATTKSYSRFVSQTSSTRHIYLRVTANSGSEQDFLIANIAVNGNGCPPGTICQ